MKEKIDLFLEDFKGRIRNPLIISYILMWLYFHWSLIYYLITCGKKIPVHIRTGVIVNYINSNGWSGMVGKPLIVAFFALTIYYLIANASQWIYLWVGKRLYAFILIKNDKGKVVLKTLFEQEEEKSKDLKNKLHDAKQEIEKLEKHKIQIDSLMDQHIRSAEDAYSEMEKTQNNINYNIEFKTQLTRSLIHLLSAKVNMEVVGALKPIIENFKLSTFNGGWEIRKFRGVEESSFESLAINIDNQIISKYDGTPYGTTVEFIHDKTTSLCRLKIDRWKATKTTGTGDDLEVYELLQINKKEFIGLSRKYYVTLTRREEIEI